MGPYVSTIVIKIAVKLDQTISKPKEEYNKEDKWKLTLNVRAKNLLYCVLNKNIFNSISTCNSAYDIWHAFEITHMSTGNERSSN